ncbi:MAG TPA: 3-oxoacid CoA-transferase subunit B [Bacteroidales bacterium]|nr:3-oxoacid CoA-transferase subunit B [Bacteroidales bacterium]
MDKNEIRDVIAKRAALELKDGFLVNLGIGLPTLVPNYLKEGVEVLLQSENGIIGMGASPKAGEENKEIVNAGGAYTSVVEGGSTFDSAMSFSIIRGGHVDVSILGAMQVDKEGNLANWAIPGKKVPGMGGAMDLVVGAKKVILAMEHTARGSHKILDLCTLPLTAAGQVDMIITEMGVMNITEEGIVLRELHPSFTLEDIQNATGTKLIIPKDLIPMQLH